MAEQTAQPETPPRASAVHAEAMRELAAAIHDLAGSIRESASFAGEIEWVPCDESAVPGGDDDGPGGDNGGGAPATSGGSEEPVSASRAHGASQYTESSVTPDRADDGQAAERAALQLVPVQGIGCQDAAPACCEPGRLCRPGGCRCAEAHEGVGRHARRDPVMTLVEDASYLDVAPADAR